MALVCAALVTSACSLIVERNAEVCATTADCIAKGGDFAETVCKDHACAFCSSNADCIDGSRLGVCTQGRCKSLFANGCYSVSTGTSTAESAGAASAELRRAIGNDKNLVLFGAVLQNNSKGIERWNGVQTAAELVARVGGIPRPAPAENKQLAFVACPDTTDAASYLVGLGVRAIVSGSGSAGTLRIANDVTIKSDTLLFAASATSADITALRTPLVWRAAPSDTVQAAALLALLQPLVQIGNPQAKTVHVATIFVNDAYGRSLADLVATTRKPDVTVDTFFYATASDAAGNLTASIAPKDADAIVDAHPDVVVMVGSIEVVDGVYKPLRDRLTATPPYFVFSDGAKSDALAQAVADDATWRPRVRVTAPKEPPIDRRAYDVFLSEYRGLAGASPSAYGVAGSYDAAYLLALAVAGVPEGQPLTGTSLATVLRRVSDKSTPARPATPDSLGEAARALAPGGNIDFLGASGELDFSSEGVGEAKAPISVYCIQKATSGGSQESYREVAYFVPDQGLTSGSAAPLSVQCP